jgi:hypothetical protein
MKASRWLPVLCVVCLGLSGCGGRHRPKKPDPTKGTVTGVVICDDTGKPARFATVTLTAAISKDDKSGDNGPLPAIESADTDLDGRFRMEAVEPGRYYAFATLEGYLDPARGIDFAKLEGMANDHDRSLEAIHEWRDQMVEVRVGVHAHPKSAFASRAPRRSPALSPMTTAAPPSACTSNCSAKPARTRGPA